MNDVSLVYGLKHHDQSALAEIIEKYTPLISTIINNIANGILTTADIEEVTADVFYILWINAEKVREDSLKGYLCSIAKSKAKDRLRRVKVVQMEDIEEVSAADEFTLSDKIDNDRLHEDIEEALLQFSNQDKEILLRYYYYYQTAGKISETMGLKTETVKSRIKRAKPKLQAFLKGRGYGYHENR